MSLLRRNIKVLLQPRRYRAELGEAGRMLRSVTEPTNGVAGRIRGFLDSDSWEVRNCALKIIARTRCEELYGELVAKLLEASEAGIIRRNCAELLPDVGLRAPDVIDALRRALRDRYWEVRAESARALAQLSDESPELERELLSLLARENNMEVRAALAQALGGLGVTRGAFDALAGLARREPWLVRHQASVALAEMGARRPDLAEDAAEAIRSLDLLAEGTATTSVFRQNVLELAELTAKGRPFPSPESMRRRYFHLKRGWLRRTVE